MTSIEFVKSKMNELVNLFPTIKCAYEYESFNNTHTIEILPSGFYEHSQSFYKISSSIDIEFIDKFPFEGLYFIDDKDLMPIKNIIYEVKGRDYNNNSIYTIAKSQTISIPTLITIPDFLKNLDNISYNYIKEAFKIENMNTTDYDKNLDLSITKEYITEDNESPCGLAA